MPTAVEQTNYQKATNLWRMRAAQFTSQGIPQSAWQQLYNRDMQGIYSGSQPMSNAEVYAAISSYQHPTIQDPKPQTGGSILSTIGHIIKNVPGDVGQIIQGLEGIPHLVLHAPQEAWQTGELLTALASTDNTWLQNHGYLPQGQKLHNSWGDFAEILRAMNANGDKQFLPLLPFLSDIANMTSGQGRQYLQQHPVTAFLDVLPGIVKVGHLALDSKVLESNAAERFNAVEALKQKGYSEQQAQANVDRLMPKDYSYLHSKAGYDRTAGSTVPRFYAAGRALQTGNPVKALVSATGDLIPMGKDEFGARQTFRNWANQKAAAGGISRKIREGVNRPIHNFSDELQANAKLRVKKLLDLTPFWNDTPARISFVYHALEGLVDPRSGTRFETAAELNDFINTALEPPEKALIDTINAIVDEQEHSNMRAGDRISIPGFTRLWEDWFPTNSHVADAWKTMQDVNAELQAANRVPANADAVAKLAKKSTDALDKFMAARRTTVPQAWMPAVAGVIRQGVEKQLNDRLAAQAMTQYEFDEAIAKLKTSHWDEDLKRLLGEDEYNAVYQDAMEWWQSLASQGVRPLITYSVDHDIHKQILDDRNIPLGSLDKPTTPEAFKREKQNLYVGPQLEHLTMAIAGHDLEVLRQQLVTRLIHEVIIPQFTVSKTAKYVEYAKAIGDAKIKVRTGTSMEHHIVDLIAADFDGFDPARYGIVRKLINLPPNHDLLITREASLALQAEMTPSKFEFPTFVVKGTKLFKFSVLTGPRHFIHVSMGGLAMLLMREPTAVADLLKTQRMLKALREGDPTAARYFAHMGLENLTLSGLRGKVYELPILHKHWNIQTGSRIAEDVQMSWIHEAREKGLKVAEYIPNKLAFHEENLMDMYRVSAFIRGRKNGLDRATALEIAHKVTVDVNGMSHMERVLVKQLFPFYAFTRHLFRFLMTMPVDYPLRTAILTNIAQGYQQDWNNGLPRSYMSLFSLGNMNGNGTILAWDLKNLNPFRSFGNDFSLAGFTSSMSPFLSGIAGVMGLDTLSGTTQLYPGTIFNPQTGSLQATPPPGGQWTFPEAFVPQLGLLDHYFKLTNSTKMLARFDKVSYANQLYNMLNIPLHPELVNIPYEKEITEIRRFRQAQSDVSALESDPSARNVAKVMQWNLVPWNNELIPSSTLAAYYKRIADALANTAQVGIAPKAVVHAPPSRPATLPAYLGQTTPYVPSQTPVIPANLSQLGQVP